MCLKNLKNGERVINLGIIGNGFVGSAVAHGFSLCATLRIYDKNEKLSTHSFDDVIKNSEFIVVSVPTPSSAKTGIIDLSIMDSVMEDISALISPHSIVIIKSTAIPGTTDRYMKKYPQMNIVFNPEFLSERTARMDFMNPARIVIGGAPEPRSRVEKLYRNRFPHTKIIETDAKTAEFIKYMCNCFYAVKISAFNEFYQLAKKMDVSWDASMAGILSSGWVNPMHTQVPGTDGDYGFGGKCFPKDISAFIRCFEENDTKPSVMRAALEKNMEVRQNLNWLYIEGAISKEGPND